MFLLPPHWAPFQHWLHRGALSDALHGTCPCLSPATSARFLRGTWHHSLWVLVTHPAVVSAWWGQDLICPLLYTLHLVHRRCSANVTRVLYRADWEDAIPMLCVRKPRPRGARGSLRAPQSLPSVTSSALCPPPPTRFHLPGALGTTHQLALWLQTPRGCVSALWLPFAYTYVFDLGQSGVLWLIRPVLTCWSSQKWPNTVDLGCCWWVCLNLQWPLDGGSPQTLWLQGLLSALLPPCLSLLRALQNPGLWFLQQGTMKLTSRFD